MSARVSKSVSRALALAFVALVPVALSAQASNRVKSVSSDYPSRWDIFAGYSYLAPQGSVTTSPATGRPLPPTTMPSMSADCSAAPISSTALLASRPNSASMSGASSPRNGSNIGTHGNDDGFLTVAGGLIARYPDGNITPFAHGLVGTAMVNGPYFQSNKWGPALTVGGGMDYETPFSTIISPFASSRPTTSICMPTSARELGGRANINAARLSTGIVLHVGTIAPPPPVTLACSASPDSVFPGDPVTVTATAGSLDPKLNAIYSWSGTGASGTEPPPLSPPLRLIRFYTVKGTVKEGKAGKEGLKPGQSADCSASFTVKAFEPPTISCSANPSTIKPGEPAPSRPLA